MRTTKHLNSFGTQEIQLTSALPKVQGTHRLIMWKALNHQFSFRCTKEERCKSLAMTNYHSYMLPKVIAKMISCCWKHFWFSCYQFQQQSFIVSVTRIKATPYFVGAPGRFLILAESESFDVLSIELICLKSQSPNQCWLLLCWIFFSKSKIWLPQNVDTSSFLSCLFS